MNLNQDIEYFNMNLKTSAKNRFARHMDKHRDAVYKKYYSSCKNIMDLQTFKKIILDQFEKNIYSSKNQFCAHNDSQHACNKIHTTDEFINDFKVSMCFITDCKSNDDRHIYNKIHPHEILRDTYKRKLEYTRNAAKFIEVSVGEKIKSIQDDLNSDYYSVFLDMPFIMIFDLLQSKDREGDIEKIYKKTCKVKVCNEIKLDYHNEIKLEFTVLTINHIHSCSAFNYDKFMMIIEKLNNLNVDTLHICLQQTSTFNFRNHVLLTSIVTFNNTQKIIGTVFQVEELIRMINVFCTESCIDNFITID